MSAMNGEIGELMNGEDLSAATENMQRSGRFTATQWAWGYVIGGLALLWLMGKFVWSGR